MSVHEQSRAVLPEKQPGSWYAVVLGDPTAATGRFPAPDLGRECVCCNGPHAVLSQFDPSTGPYVSDPIPISICAECQSHVRLNEKRVVTIVSAGALGLFLSVFGFVNILFTVIGLLVFAAAAGVFLMDRNKQRALSKSGHHVGLELAAAPGYCSIRTMNPRVAQHLIDAHQGEIHRVK